MKYTVASIVFFATFLLNFPSVFSISCFECIECGIPPFNVSVVECPKEMEYCLVNTFYLKQIAFYKDKTPLLKNSRDTVLF